MKLCFNPGIKDKMIQKAVHIIFALALLLAFAPPAHAAKHSAELFLRTEHCRQADCFKK